MTTPLSFTVSGVDNERKWNVLDIVQKLTQTLFLAGYHFKFNQPIKTSASKYLPRVLRDSEKCVCRECTGVMHLINDGRGPSNDTITVTISRCGYQANISLLSFDFKNAVVIMVFRASVLSLVALGTTRRVSGFSAPSVESTVCGARALGGSDLVVSEACL